MEQDIKNELNTKKEILNKHLAKFNQLKNESKWSEAWKQLIITLNYANETLKYSANLLKDLEGVTPEQQESIGAVVDTIDNKAASLRSPDVKSVPTPQKIIVIPKKVSIH